MYSFTEIHNELINFTHVNLKVPLEILIEDPDFQSLNLDSLSILEILLHGDDTYGSHVLDYLEDGLIDGERPSKLSELAVLIPKCMNSVND